MTPETLNYNPNYTQPKPKFSLQKFFQEHPLALILLVISIIMVVVTIFIIMFSSPRQDPEKAPFVTFSNEAILEDYLPSSLNDDIMFYLRLILLNNEELASMPDKTLKEENHIVTFNLDSLQVSTVANISDSNLYTINFTVSDGREYVLRILFNDDYRNEYAVTALSRTLPSEANYIITFTNYTSEYYQTIGGPNFEQYLAEYTGITDSLSDLPLQEIPSIASVWINTLHLANPEYIYAALPNDLY